MMINLAPCPFCGGRAHFIYTEVFNEPCVAVRCTHCNATSDNAMLIFDSGVERAFETVAEFWNDRV